MTPIQPKSSDKTQATTAPRLSLTRERLHFVSYPAVGARQGPRMRLTGSLVGRR